MPAERLGKYELVRHLASGGMASVYLARLSGLAGFERHVVLKTLQSEGLADETLVPMFLDEARLVATLHHQHIAQVYELGRDASTYWLAMEYVHGETVRGVLETAGKHGQILSLDFGLTVVCAAAAGLHHAHERCNAQGVPLGIVHRDVTPSNVIVSYDGSIKLIDFGIAKANDRTTKTQSGFIKGKAGYMAPEQVKGYPVDRRSDVFALGVLAYELTTQSRAFQANSQFEQLERIANGLVTPPSETVSDYPVELEDVVMKALEVDPDDRYQDAHALRAELERVASELGLRLGEDSVIGVLADLYGPRPEPWLVAPGLIDYDITPSVVDLPFAIEVIQPKQPVHGFARGSDAKSLPEDVDPILTEPVDFDDIEIITPPVVGSTMLATWPRMSTRAIVFSALLAAGFVTAIAVPSEGPPEEPIAAPVANSPTKPPIASPPTVAKPSTSPVAKPPVVPTPAVAAANPAKPADAPSKSAASIGHVMLDVVTDPPDATVVLDGVRLGRSPYHAEVVAKPTAWLKVRKTDRIPVRVKVSLDRDYTWTVQLPPR